MREHFAAAAQGQDEGQGECDVQMRPNGSECGGEDERDSGSAEIDGGGGSDGSAEIDGGGGSDHVDAAGSVRLRLRGAVDVEVDINEPTLSTTAATAASARTATGGVVRKKPTAAIARTATGGVVRKKQDENSYGGVGEGDGENDSTKKQRTEY